MEKRAIARMADDPGAFLSRFKAVTLVANSPDAASVLGEAAREPETLFVFFNKVFRILDRPFEGHSLLVSRSSPVGSSLIYRKELGEVTRLLDGPSFHGVLNIRASEPEIFSPRADFGREDVGYLDLTGYARTIYPQGQRMPSTGFALAVWLAHLKLGLPIRLAGFSGVRESTWRVYDVHDWTWEQTVLQLFYQKGLLIDAGVGRQSDRWPIDALTAQFETISASDVQLAATQVLSHRLGGANRAIDQIFSTIKLQLGLAAFIRKLRPKSRKARAREKLKERIARGD